MMKWINKNLMGVYHVSAKYSGHRLQRLEVTNGLDLTEVALEVQIHWTAYWVGAGCQVRGAGWTTIIGKWSAGGSSRVVDQPKHQQANEGSKTGRQHCCKNNTHFTPLWYDTLASVLQDRQIHPSDTKCAGLCSLIDSYLLYKIYDTCLSCPGWCKWNDFVWMLGAVIGYFTCYARQ